MNWKVGWSVQASDKYKISKSVIVKELQITITFIKWLQASRKNKTKNTIC